MEHQILKTRNLLLQLAAILLGMYLLSLAARSLRDPPPAPPNPHSVWPFVTSSRTGVRTLTTSN